MKELLIGLPFEFSPQLIRPPQQRHIVRVFKISLPDDPRLSVRAAAVVSAGKAVEAEDRRSFPREMKRRCAPHAASAEDDCIVLAHSSA